MFLHKNVGFFSQLPILYFRQVTVIPTISFYQNDPYLNYVVLNINGDTALSGNNNTFLDSGFRNISANGNVTQGTFSPFSPAGWSGYFDGASYLTAPASTAYTLSGDFTIEFWVNTNVFSGDPAGRHIISMGTGADAANLMKIGLWNSTGSPSNLLSLWSTSLVLAGNIIVADGGWHHVAITRSGTNLRLYVDGVQSGSTTTTSQSFNAGATTSIQIGRQNGAENSRYNGYLSNLRIIKDTALYTSNFTPNSAEPLKLLPNTSLLTLQDNRFKDNSRNNFTLSATGTPQIQPFSPIAPAVDYTPSLHGGSGYFDGSLSYLNIPNDTSLILQNSNFTVDFWMYPISNGKPYSIVFTLNGHATSGFVAIRVDIIANNVIRFLASENGTTWKLEIPSSNNTIKYNTWQHVATVRNGQTITLYVDGINVASGSLTSATQSLYTGPLNYIGYMGFATDYSFTGYISNLRVIKGQAVYTSNFTPPSRPVTAISNGGASVGTTAVPNLSVTPSLLLDFDNGGIIDRSYKNDALVFGDSKTQTLSSKFGTGSLYFDGTGDYLTIPNNPNLALGTSDFTIEFWINRVVDGTQSILEWRASVPSETRPFIWINPSSNISFYVLGAERITNTLSQNTWNHVAIVRNSSVTRMFVNGVSASTTYTDTNDYLAPTNGLKISTNFALIAGLNGYLEDIRVTKGVARYTTNNFTPPPKLQANNSDPYYSNVVLFLDGNNIGSNVNNEFRATAGNGARLPITRTGSTTQGSFSPFSPNGWSGYFNGNTDYLTTTSTEPFNYSGDLTIEMWFFPNTPLSQTSSLISKRGSVTDVGGIQIVFATTNGTIYKPILYVSYDNSSWEINTNSTIDCNIAQWNHIAVTRSGNQWKLFVNGVVGVDQTAVGTFLANTAAFTIGAGAANGSQKIKDAYISNLRIVKRQALYTSNFTPPTGPLPALSGSGFSTSLLTLQDNRFKDNSPNNLTISVNGTPSIQAFNPYKQTTAYSPTVHGGSGYFDGSSYLTVPANNAFAFGTGAYTIEAWVFLTARNSTWGSVIIAAQNYGSTPNFAFSVSTAGNLRLEAGTSTFTSTQIIPLNTWTHVAFTNSGLSTNTIYSLYINGVQQTQTIASPPTVSSTINVAIGSSTDNNAGARLTGYISNLRVVKGRALYTSTFTPPTSPVTAVNGTSLLLNFDNGYAIDSTGNNVITTVGDSRTDVLSTAPLSSSTGSLYFDGASHISVPINNNLQLQSSDFTIESWIYTISTSQQTIVGSMNAAGSSGSFSLYINNTSGLIRFFIRSTSNVDYMVGTGTIPLNVWNHIAVTRQGSNLRIFLNGQQIGVTNTTLGANNITDTTSPIIIGSSTENSVNFNGYIDDLRITKGVARYTSNFTPQTYENPTSNILTYPTDPYRNLVVLDLNADTVNNEQNNTFLDRSGNNLPITRSGSTTQGSFSPFSPAGWSGYFDGNSYLSIPANSAFAFGTGDFTIELWINRQSSVNQTYIALSNTGVSLYYDVNLQILRYFVSASLIIPATLSPCNWNHVAVVRQSSVTKMYINGVAAATSLTDTTDYTSTNPMLIGGSGPTSNSIGYISNLRIVKGQALYTSNFTPLTAALTTTSTVSGVLSAENVSLLTLQDNRFKDNSNNNFTLTVTGSASVKRFSPFQPTATYSPTVHGGSGYFNNSIDCLSVASNALFSIGTDRFTLEFWINFTSWSSTGVQRFFVLGASGTDGIAIYQNNNNIQINLVNTSKITYSFIPTLNTWYHFTLIRRGTGTNELCFYINGLNVANATSTENIAQNPVNIGGLTWANNFQTLGYISNLRFVKGVAITPPVGGPTAPVQAVSGTSLLLNFDNAGVVDSTGKNNVTTFSGAKVDYVNTRYGSGALKFNGTSDYMQVGTASDWTFLHSPNAKWTIEFWVYNNSTASTGLIVDTSNNAQDGSGIIIYKEGTTNKIRCFINNMALSIIDGTSTNTLLVSSWTHFAITYDHSLASNNMVMYFNGLSSNVFSKSANTPSTNNPPNTLSIGCKGNGTGGFLNGAIDELRITNAVRYTGNFSVSSYTLPLSS